MVGLSCQHLPPQKQKSRQLMRVNIFSEYIYSLVLLNRILSLRRFKRLPLHILLGASASPRFSGTTWSIT